MSWPDTFRPIRPALLGALLLASPAAATRTVAPADVATLTARSAAVVRGAVLAASTDTDGPLVRTRYTIARDQLLTGTAPAVFEVVLPGGTVDDLAVEVPGVPVWDVGDEVIVFVDDEGRVPLDGALTVQAGLVHDPHDRPAAAVPATVRALVEALAAPVPRPDPR